MASPGLITIAQDTDFWEYKGQARAGTTTPHGQGVATYKGANSGRRYEGEWQDGKQSGQGVYTWPNGERYEGGWQDGKRSGRGVVWLPSGRVFDGAWAEHCPLRGTAMEPDGALSLATFDGKLGTEYLDDGSWAKAKRAPAGRVASGGPPPPGGRGGPPPAWAGRVELRGGAVLEGRLRGLRPDGPATLAEGGGAARAVEYDGARTLAEGPVPAPRKEVRTPRARIPTDG